MEGQLPPSSPVTRRRFSEFHPSGVELSKDTVDLMEKKRVERQAVAFDEVTLEDKPSDYHPNHVDVRSFITRRIRLKACGIISAAMDTVTEREMALAIAKNGGIGILHRNLDAETQARMVSWVRHKIHFEGMIERPITFKPNQYYSELQHQIHSKGYTFTSFPVVDENGKLLGLLTRDEMDFVSGDDNPTLGQMMKTLDITVTAPEGTNSEQAYQIMSEKRVKKLPVIDASGHLKGMYVWSDLRKDHHKREKYSLDEKGHFLIGAAIGLGPEDIQRAQMLVDAGCSVLVLDSSHGACKPAKEQLRRLRKTFGDAVDIIAGNIASYEAAIYLLQDEDARPDALKVGIGPGSICTTRQVTGHGVPQVTAIYEVWRAVRDIGEKTGYYVPIIADGGIRSSGDIVKCLAVGASGVMLGSMLAGTDESPGSIIVKAGKNYKTIRGMGSRAAMEERSGSRGRYYRNDTARHTEQLTTAQAQKMVPEGVEGLVEYKGPLERVINTLIGGIQAGLAHTGAADVPSFQKRASLWTQSFAGVAEGNPHDITDIRH
jgi:IMP dehydrogenase